MLDTSRIVRLVVQAIPEVKPRLKGKALAFVFDVDPTYKTQPYFEATVEHLILQVYNGWMGGDFIDIMYSLISGQLYDAYVQAWEEDGNTLPLPDYLDEACRVAVVEQQDFVQQFYNDIVDARVDQTGAPTDRAALWANRWQEAKNNAMMQITSQMGGRLQWHEGDTEDKCDTCLALDGMIAYASEWEQLVQPQMAPNGKLKCGGWKCGCTLEPTDHRRSPKAFDAIVNIVMSK